MTEFLLKHSPATLQAHRPDLTVLDYLREERRKCGTKEGCASGDCGACTVVLASPNAEHNALEYRSVNACITFAGALHGRQLITVEDLEHEGELHPVQQALVDAHASQCGFCTPGFVMSLFALYKNICSGHLPVSARQGWLSLIETTLAGNLCRCTGYRPIVDAGLQLLESLQQDQAQAAASTDQFATLASQTLTQLLAMQTAADSAPLTPFYRPQTLAALDQLLASNPDARILAGGTDLALESTQQLRSLDKLICVADLPALQVFERTQNACTIGAAVTLSRLLQELGGVYPDLDELLHRFASQQVRNQGTVGGNIANASAVADLPPVLLALGAVLQLRSAAGVRELPLDAFFTAYRETALQPGEYIQSLRIGDMQRGCLKIYKISKRIDDDISTLCVAFHLLIDEGRIQSARVAFGGMAATPRRAPALEAALSGQSLSAALPSQLRSSVQQALAADFTPLSDVRASAAYRQQVAANLLQRLYLELGSDTLTQVHDYE